MEDIRVHVVDYGRTNLVMRYLDPHTGKHVTKSAGTSVRKDAIKAAGKWEAELRSGKYKPASKVTWEEFRDRYERERLTGLSDSYFATMCSALNHVESVGVQRLAQVTPDFLSRYQAALRDKGVGETTIRTYLKHLRAALGWAVEVGMLHELPKVTYPKRTRKSSAMKGRPITSVEFGRMLDKVSVVRPQDADVWTRLLNGLWLSGLRIGEALRLSWDADEPFSVDLTGKHPQFRILAEGQKAKRDEFLPMTPDFAEWLLTTPEWERTGSVFCVTVNRDAATRVVSKIGQKACVVVGPDKFATAHDLRRSFGTRWSKWVRPAVLQKLMRHADIKTTADYYILHDADDIAADLWRQHADSGNTSSNTQVGTTGFEPATF